MENIDKEHIEKLGLLHPKDYFGNMQKDLFSKLKAEEMEVTAKDKLGLDIPKGYFENSKQEVLDKIKPQTKEVDPIYFTRKFWMAFAASVAILISVSIWLNQDSNSFRTNNALTSALFQEMDGEQMMLNSLFVQDKQFDLLLDDYVYENIVLESAVPIIDKDDLTLESLFIDEESIDDLTDDLWLEDNLN